MSDEAQLSVSQIHKRYLLSAILFLAVIAVLSTFMRRVEQMKYTFTADGVEVETASGYAKTLIWDKIQEVELYDQWDAGGLIEGRDTDQERSGIWENEMLGRYEMLTDAHIQRWILVNTEKGAVVLNFESIDSTGSLYDAMLRMTEHNN